MNRLISRSAPFLVCAALLSCSRELCMEVIDSRSSHLSLSLAIGSGCDEQPKIRAVTFLRATDQSTLWSISQDAGALLSDLTYGVTPAGFSGSAAQELITGETVQISAKGWGSYGEVEVVVTGDE